MSELLSLAKESAMNFRTIAARAEVLERFRLAILPFAEWLDKPIKECFVAFNEELYHRAPKRALPIFKQYGSDLHVVAIDRRGDWITAKEVLVGKHGSAVLKKLSSVELAMEIEQARFAILDSMPWPRCTGYLKAIESLGLQLVVRHCAFLKYLNQGVEEIGRTLAEREKRMQVMRGNLTFLASFAAGVDPLVYGKGEPMKTYAVFSERPGHHSRCTGAYFVRDIVQTKVAERNAGQKSDSETRYVVFEDSVRTDAMLSFLDGIYRSIEEAATSQGVFAREPISEEEVAAIRRAYDSI
jgi:hypothetical protein